jgi:hypothetical protein
MTTSVKYGFYSEIAAKQFGTFIYLDTNNKEVEVTNISLDQLCSGYHFADKVCLGQVTTFVRKGRRGNDSWLKTFVT